MNQKSFLHFTLHTLIPAFYRLIMSTQDFATIRRLIICTLALHVGTFIYIRCMKRPILLCLLPLLWVLTGCPVSVDYPLGYAGKEKIDDKLIGTWITSDTSAEVISFVFEKADAFSLKVKVLERGSMYAEDVDDFKGWCTSLGDKQFVYFQNAADASAGYYSYCYWFNTEGNLVASDFALLVGGVDAVTSTENYRREVSQSMANPDWLGTAFTYTKK